MSYKGSLTTLLLAFALLAVSPRVQAQTSHSTTTDPDEIAAECGGTADAGKPYFASCSECHALTADAPPMRGPHLEGVFGRKIADVAGFPYSKAMMEAGRAGGVWDRDRLHAYLENPAAHMPGTLMEYDGLTSEQQRRDLLTYMRTATIAPPPARGELKLSDAVWALEGDAEYGEYLSGECMTCHQDHAAGQGIPDIYSLPEPAFIYAMHEYRVKARPNQAMQMVAGVLGDEEIAALAAYFSQNSN